MNGRAVGRIVVISVIMLGLGCARRGDVSGTVRLDGKPLVFGTVQFEASDGKLHNGLIEEDGSYFIPGVAHGETRVAVSSQNPTSAAFQPLHRVGIENQATRPKAVQGWFPIPSKYEMFANSGLTIDVKSGENQIDIELKK
jgi:hypothetical protein